MATKSPLSSFFARQGHKEVKRSGRKRAQVRSVQLSVEQLEHRYVLASTFFTDIAQFDVQSVIPPDAPPINITQLSSTQGRTFNNHLALGNPVAGDPGVVVGALPIVSVKDTSGATHTGILDEAGQNQFVVVFAIQGTFFDVVPGGPAEAIAFSAGQAGLFTIPNTSAFVGGNPLTWGSTDGTGSTLLTPLITWALKPPEDVMPGPPPAEQIFFEAEQVNTSSVNTIAGQQFDARMLFREIADAGDLLNVIGVDLDLVHEGLFAESFQTVIAGTGFDPTLTPGQLAAAKNALNTIADDLGLLPPVNGVGTGSFATFGSGNAFDYTPGSNGDIVANFNNVIAEPGIQFEPPEICGSKFNDLTLIDGEPDGIWDPNGADDILGNEDDEVGLDNWEIHLDGVDFRGNEVHLVTFTDEFGNYCFMDDPNTPEIELLPGTYTVSEVLQPGWRQTAPTPIPPGTYEVTVASGEIIEDRDFGNINDVGGLTPGFWKGNDAHAQRRPEKFGDENGVPLAWVKTGVLPTDKLEDYGFIGFPDDITFREALNSNGGGINALLRHTAAAYLNAAHDEGMEAAGEDPCVGYPLSTAEIVALVNAALADGSADVINDLKDLFAGYNESGAIDGLDQFGRCGDELVALRPETAAPVATSTVVVAPSVQLAPASTSSSGGSTLAAAVDVVFESVSSADLLLALPAGSSGEEEVNLDAASSTQPASGENADWELADDVFELLSVA